MLSRVSASRKTAKALQWRPLSSLPTDGAGESASTMPKARRRRRHNFDNLDEVPSFQVFQQRTQVRSLYRQYLRTIAPLDSMQRTEILQQIQHEFRKVKVTATNNKQDKEAASKSHWEVQRALSEGTRRLKELGSMLGTVVKIKPTNQEAEPALQQPTVPENPWPWQR